MNVIAGVRNLDRAIWPHRFLDWEGRVPERMTINLPLIPRVFLTASPEDCRAVFTDRSGTLLFGEGLRRFAPHEALFGHDALDALDGPDHTRFRRQLTSAFHGEALRGYQEGIVEVTERHVAQWPVGEPVRMVELCRVLARDVIATTVFGVREPARAARLVAALERLDAIVNSLELAGRFAAAVALRGRWAPYPKMQAVHDEIAAVTMEEIAERRARGDVGEAAGRADCLARFLGPVEEEVSDEEICAAMRVLVIAGWATTANTLAWMCERLARSPAALEACRADALEGGDGRFLTATVQETLRMRPPVPVTLRYVTADFDLGDEVVPAGTTIATDIERIHYRADIYEDPRAFRPERFISARPGTYTWIPFGGGVHRCIGAGFALTEARLILGTMLRSVTFAPTAARGERSRRSTLITGPVGGATVTLRPA